MPKKDLTCLVLSGGGSKIVATIGAMCHLQIHRPNYLQKLKRVVGTSAGAIVALLLCCRYTVSELQFLLDDLDMSQFISIDLSFLLQPKILGLDSGTRYMQWMAERMIEKHISPSVTLRQLEEKTGMKLITITTDVNSRGVYCYSPDAEPNYPAIWAVRASIGIPILFRPVIHDDRCLIDGGVLCAFAFDLLLNLVAKNEVIFGICLDEPNPFGKDNNAEAALNEDVGTHEGHRTPKNIYEMFCACLSMMTPPPYVARLGKKATSKNTVRVGRHSILHIPLSKYYNVIAAPKSQQDELFDEGWNAVADVVSGS